MLDIGRQDIEALASAIESGNLFRYGEATQCARFEERYGATLGVHHVALCSSGTAALTAALAGLEIGPGDEVIVPAHTYMATALAVLSVGAIPVVVDIDESIMLSPTALEESIGPHTRAVIPVHMWGQVCDMDAIMRIARDHGLVVVEDACQCVGGTYRGRPVGGIGDAGAFSFNFFKNMTCGEGGAVVTNSTRVCDRARCMIDPCSYYWEGRGDAGAVQPFSNCGTRASELQGAMLNAQLDRLGGLLDRLRAVKAEILRRTRGTGPAQCPRHSPDGECATSLLYLLPDPDAAQLFATRSGGAILLNTGRHTYTEWDQILNRRGSHHPALNPFDLPQNARCRTVYRADMCPASLDILARTVKIALEPGFDRGDINRIVDVVTAEECALQSA